MTQSWDKTANFSEIQQGVAIKLASAPVPQIFLVWFCFCSICLFCFTCLFVSMPICFFRDFLASVLHQIYITKILK